MEFVVCTDKTYEEKYQSQHWKYPHMWDARTVLGFTGSRPDTTANVLIHEDDISEVMEDNIDIEVELKVLADFRVINLTYVDDMGMHHKYRAPEVVV